MGLGKECDNATSVDTVESVKCPEYRGGRFSEVGVVRREKMEPQTPPTIGFKVHNVHGICTSFIGKVACKNQNMIFSNNDVA